MFCLISIAEVNIGLICACLPMLPKFYKSMARTAKTIISRTSTYHELDPLGHKGTTGVSRARPGDTGEQRKEAAAESVALHQQYLGADAIVDRSVTASGGTQDGEGRERSWNGLGILKTVSLDTWETPMAPMKDSLAPPSKAVIHSSVPEHSEAVTARR